MPSKDQDSRLQTTTTTVEPEYYDMVLALSCQIINQSWASLFAQYPDAQNIHVGGEGSGDPNIGELKGTLSPCEIFITGDIQNGLDCHYCISFKDGTLQNHEKTLAADLMGWKLVVDVKILNAPYDNLVKGQQQFIDHQYMVPTDYSITGLYADITNADWNYINNEESTFGIDPTTGQAINWATWKTNNPTLQRLLVNFLGAWTDDQQANGMNMLGISLTYPSEQQQNPLNPTYVPTSIFHQGFPYDNNTATNPAYNCLLYCQQISQHPPPSSPYISGFCGNWCYPAENGPAVDGTFAMSAQIYLGQFLEPHLRPMNQASEVIPTETLLYEYRVRTTEGLMPYPIARWDSSVGYNANHTLPSDTYFQLRPLTDGSGYGWSTSSHGQQEPVYFDIYPDDPAGNGWASLIQNGKSFATTNVTAIPKIGSNVIALSGNIQYQWEYRKSDSRDSVKNSDPAALAHYTATWELDLEITSTEDGQVSVALSTRPEDIDPQVVCDMSKGSLFNRATWDEDAKSILKGKLHDSLSASEQNMANAFRSNGNFIYPGNGEFIFQRPLFNQHSDLLLEVAYKQTPLNTPIKIPGLGDGPTFSPYVAAQDASVGGQIGQNPP
ncbi:hypothetical protein FE257_000695 [Aspergillus nanangensis]|uniref:Uncharacterized protein n=1 Tax=Aspergillus nanangensis TaxID=2582783 RepID=A0AAD4CEX6_ASPNN|nr:hypothetical protein FE257_000695 [Aspergillus nanangensis]